MSESKYQIPEEPVVSNINEIDLSLTYSYANYLNWLFEDRVELLQGKVFKMTGPSRFHQRVSGKIFLALGNYLESKPCQVYIAPFDVRFPKESKADEDIYTVLQPDICVVCDPSKLDDRGCIGAPDIVVEILSPGNNQKELLNKYKLYEEFGVKEYWIVSPSVKTFFKYTLEGGKYRPSKLYTLGEEVQSDILPGFTLNLDKVFED